MISFDLATQIFMFTVRTTKSLSSYFLKEELTSKRESDILLERSAKIGSLIQKIYEDKKINLADIPELIDVIKEASIFVGFDFEKAAMQIANATKDELEEAFKLFDNEFSLPDKNKEQNLEIIFHEIFNIINSSYRIYKICGKIK